MLALQQMSGMFEPVSFRQPARTFESKRAVAGHIALESLARANLGNLIINWQGEMRNTAVAKGRTAGEVNHIFGVSRAHQSLIEDRHILIQVILVHVL